MRIVSRHRNVLIISALMLFVFACVVAIGGPRSSSLQLRGLQSSAIESIKRKTDFFTLHEDDFSRAIDYAQEWECYGLCLEPAPNEIRQWAGQDSYVARISEPDHLIAFRIDSDVGSFTYIPRPVSVPERFKPQTGVIISCSTEYGNGWYECNQTLD